MGQTNQSAVDALLALAAEGGEEGGATENIGAKWLRYAHGMMIAAARQSAEDRGAADPFNGMPAEKIADSAEMNRSVAEHHWEPGIALVGHLVKEAGISWEGLGGHLEWKGLKCSAALSEALAEAGPPKGGRSRVPCPGEMLVVDFQSRKGQRGAIAVWEGGGVVQAMGVTIRKEGVVCGGWIGTRKEWEVKGENPEAGEWGAVIIYPEGRLGLPNAPKEQWKGEMVKMLKQGWLDGARMVLDQALAQGDGEQTLKQLPILDPRRLLPEPGSGKAWRKREKARRREVARSSLFKTLILPEPWELGSGRRRGDGAGEAGAERERSGPDRHAVRAHWRWQPCGTRSERRELRMVRAHWRGGEPGGQNRVVVQQMPKEENR